MGRMDEHVAGLLGIDLGDPATVAGIADVEKVACLIETLVHRREEQGITLAQVAEAMETTQAAVADFERVGGDPRLSTIMRYARAVGMVVDPVAYLGDEALADGFDGELREKYLRALRSVQGDDPLSQLARMSLRASAAKFGRGGEG